MSNQTFYLKYRPQKIYDLDINSVRESLTKIVASGSIPHAFLFAGPKGTGKTSAARILAKIINCEHLVKLGEPCNKCGTCKSITTGSSIDVIEMDAASNRGIDDIRVLRDAVKLAPLQSKAKVYIIDEAHMLTVEASNALLKTLEEPPVHVYFILATTNPEKLIDTIRSRTTEIFFNKATKEELVRSLNRIIKSEKLKLSTDDIDLVINLSKGSFRDAVKILERIALQGTEFLKNESIDLGKLIDYIEIKDDKEIIKVIQKLIDGGVSPNHLTENILMHLRFKLLGKNGTKINKGELILLIELLLVSIEMTKYSPIDELPLELAFVKWFNKINGPKDLEKNN